MNEIKVQRLKISKFRGVDQGTIFLKDHTLIVGGNSVGKSTVCEALDLLLGPDRLSRTNPIDEHDFFQRQYLNEDDEPILIELEVVLTDLSDDLARKYRLHREYWDGNASEILDEVATPEDLTRDGVVPALRLKFEGKYDREEDEFAAVTYFASPPPEEEDRRVRVSRSAKRLFGFLYLRALRTGARALSLERGSLLDIILRLRDDDRAAMWEETLRAIEGLKPPIDSIRQLTEILDEVDERVRKFVGLSGEDRAFRLFASSLTRESLRRSVTLFGASERSNTAVPYWRLGSGVINSMVFSLLTFIAENKPNVIFAMEEPEIAIPPHTQRRIVQFLKTNMDQSILTTHSPFVLEQFDPEEVMLLERDDAGLLSGEAIAVEGIKSKAYKGNLRRIIAEAILGRAVICVEGVSDAEVLQSASAVLEAYSDAGTYTPLDLSGITIVQCEGDGGLVSYGEFFSGIGKNTYAFYDRQKNNDIIDQIDGVFDRSWQLVQTGIEYLLAEEVPLATLRRFLENAQTWDDYPTNPRQANRFAYDPGANEDAVRGLVKRVLKARKGAGYAKALVELCGDGELPELVTTALDEISEDLPNDLILEDNDDDGIDAII